MKGIVIVSISVLLLAGSVALSAASSMSHPFVQEIGQGGLVKEGHFSGPQSIAVDSEGNLYVTDLGNRRVQKFDTSGQFETAWGSSGSGPGQFTSPAGITVADGHVYVVDSRLARVQQFATNGTFVSEFGSKGDRPGEFSLPTGITAHQGMLYVVDTANHRIQKFDLNGTFVSEFGSSGTGKDQFISPVGITVTVDGDIYVSDSASNSIKRFDADGNYLDIADGNVAGFAVKPHGLASDANGNVYVADVARDRIILLGADGMALSVWGSNGAGPGEFKSPRDLTLDSDGYLYVVESIGHRIQKFQTPAVHVAQEEPETEQQEAKPAPQDTPDQKLQAPRAVPDDFVKPTIMTPPDIVVEATGPKTPVNIGQAMATDASGIESLTHNAPEHFTLGQNSIIWTAIDGAGNLAIATQSVTVQDTTPPAITPLADITAEAKAPTGNEVALDTPTASDALGILSLESDAPDSFPIGTTTVTWTARDIVGNTATATQTVNIIDTRSPTIHAPDDIIVEAGTTQSVFIGEPTVIDNGRIISITNDAPASYEIGETVVTWAAVDSSGNSATATQKITLVDTTLPEFGKLQDITVEAVSAESNTVDIPTPVVNDVGSVNVTGNAPDLFPIGDTVVTWTAVDSSGNVMTAEQTVSVIDTTPPVITPPGDVTMEASSLLNNVVDMGEATAHDISPIASITSDAPPAFEVGDTVVTWIAVDAHGNSATATQRISVIDTTAPSITIDGDIVVEAVSAAGTAVDLADPTVRDLVGVSTVISSAPDTFGLGQTTVTWTAVDSSGNIANANQTVTVQDTAPPVITPPADIVQEASGPGVTPVQIGLASADDLIGVAAITSDAPEAFPLGSTIVTWTAVDASGNAASANQTVTVQDTAAPVITAPADIVAEATGADSNVIDTGMASADDLVGVAAINSDAPEAFQLGSTIVTWTAVDMSGNTAVATQTVTIQDTTPPLFSELSDVIVEAISDGPRAVELSLDIAQDSVSDLVITNNAPEAFPLGTTVITWTATDTSGNTQTAIQTVIVRDTTPPVITAPADIVAEATGADSNVIDTGMASADDLVGVAAITSNAPGAFPLGTTVITWTATDTSGNTAAANQTVTVQDTTPPVITAPADIVAEATGQLQSVNVGGASATDEVSVATITNDSPGSFGSGSTVITWTAVDTSGNTAAATQTVTVQDTTPPVITAPADIVVEAESADQNRLDIGEASAHDIMGNTTITNNAPEAFPLGTTVITWTATDTSGNNATATQTVTVQDTTPPVITAPADISAEATSGTDNIIIIGTANATDTVDMASVTNNAPDMFPYGTTVVTWTATDTSGNNATATQTVTVQDTTQPVITAPDDIIVEAVGVDNNPVDTGVAQASDIVDIVSLTSDAPEYFALGDTIVTWIALDQDQNVASDTQTVTVIDTTAPALVTPPDIVTDAVSLQNVIDLGTATSTDIIDQAPSISNNAPESFLLGTTEVVWTSTDLFGNSVNSTQTVEVQACGRPASSYNMIMGTSADDILSGTAGPDLIFALEGNDVVIGGGGDDCIFGGHGNDVLSGNGGADVISGGLGDDVLRGLTGADRLDGNGGLDVLDGGDQADMCVVSHDDGDIATGCE